MAALSHNTEEKMVRAFVFDSSSYKEAFAKKAQQCGVKVCTVEPSGLALAESVAKAALSMDIPADECVYVSSSLEGHKAARRNKMVSFGVGCKESELDQILSGADAVLDSLDAFPAFADVTAFDKAVNQVVRDFYDRTIIGQMLSGAKEVMQHAYAPYSKFHVGAVLRTDTGNLYRGCNVENASFGGTICAERGAAMASIATEGAGRFNLIAIASQAEDPAPPCAICRQFLSEFTPADAQVYLISTTSDVLRHYNFGTLMPYTFTEF